MTKETITRSGWPRPLGGRARLAIVALACSGAALIAGCSSGSPESANKTPKPPGTSAASQSPKDEAHASPTGSPSVSQAVCVHINSLRTSLTSLTHISVSATSANELSKDLANIEQQLRALKGEDLGSFTPEAKELMARIDSIKKDAAELSTNPTKAAKSLSADVTTLRTEAGPMIVQMKKVCHVS